MNDEPFITALAVARHLSLSRDHVLRLTRQGILPSYKIGRSIRYKLSDIIRTVAALSRGIQ